MAWMCRDKGLNSHLKQTKGHYGKERTETVTD
jgi:hypothetical protein